MSVASSSRVGAPVCSFGRLDLRRSLGEYIPETAAGNRAY